jgi:hypothetical protein
MSQREDLNLQTLALPLAIRRCGFPQLFRSEAVTALDHNPRAVFNVPPPNIGTVGLRPYHAAIVKLLQHRP